MIIQNSLARHAAALRLDHDRVAARHRFTRVGQGDSKSRAYIAPHPQLRVSDGNLSASWQVRKRGVDAQRDLVVEAVAAAKPDGDAQWLRAPPAARDRVGDAVKLPRSSGRGQELNMCVRENC